MLLIKFSRYSELIKFHISFLIHRSFSCGHSHPPSIFEYFASIKSFILLHTSSMGLRLKKYASQNTGKPSLNLKGSPIKAALCERALTYVKCNTRFSSILRAVEGTLRSKYLDKMTYSRPFSNTSESLLAAPRTQKVIGVSRRASFRSYQQGRSLPGYVKRTRYIRPINDQDNTNNFHNIDILLTTIHHLCFIGPRSPSAIV